MKTLILLCILGLSSVSFSAESDLASMVFNDYKKFKTIAGFLKEFKSTHQSELVKLLEDKLKESNLDINQQLPKCFFSKTKEILCGDNKYSLDKNNNFKINGAIFRKLSPSTDPVDSIIETFNSIKSQIRKVGVLDLLLTKALASGAFSGNFEMVGPAIVLQLQFHTYVSNDALSIGCFNGKFHICMRSDGKRDMDPEALIRMCVRFNESAVLTGTENPFLKFFNLYGFTDVLRNKNCDEQTVVQVRNSFDSIYQRYAESSAFFEKKEQALWHIENSSRARMREYAGNYVRYVLTASGRLSRSPGNEYERVFYGQ